MSTSILAAGAFCLAALDLVCLALLARQAQRNRQAAAIALEDACHEFETGLAFLDSQIRARRRARSFLPYTDDKGA